MLSGAKGALVKVDLIRRGYEVRAQIQNCTGCGLHSGGTPVPFSGIPGVADIVVIGEAPGRTEMAQGEPFIGRAGKLARTWFEQLSISPERLGWINTVSCLPLDDAGRICPPTAIERYACRDNLRAQLELFAPRFCILFGQTALLAFWPLGKISNLHGKWWELSYSFEKTCHAMVTYHPAAALRNGEYGITALDDLSVFALSAVDDVPPWQMRVCYICNGEATNWFRGIASCAAHYPSLRMTG